MARSFVRGLQDLCRVCIEILLIALVLKIVQGRDEEVWSQVCHLGIVLHSRL